MAEPQEQVDLRAQHTGIDKWNALPVPIEYLGDMEARIAMDLPIEVPESIIVEGFQVRRLIQEMADQSTEDYWDVPNMGATRLEAIRQHNVKLLADFHVRQRLLVDSVEVVFVDGEVIMPIKDDDSGGTAGIGAEVTK